MPKLSKGNNINRILDANINRSKEGLRVCEEITRFILDNRNLTFKFKQIRHRIGRLVKRLTTNINIIKERKSLQDVGKKIYINELKRKNCLDIFFANMQRVKESIRVLEEFSKLKNINIAIKFKEIRYDIYEIEKKAAQKIKSLRHIR